MADQRLTCGSTARSAWELEFPLGSRDHVNVNDVVVTPDMVSLGVLVNAVPRDVVDAAVAGCGVESKRKGGKLPPHVTAYLMMALCLFSDDDYEEVATKVTGSLSRWGCWDAAWTVPTASGITQARKRLGRNIMSEVFDGVAQPVATGSTRGAWLRHWRLMAIDGFEVDVPDTEANAAEFGYAGSGENRSAFPKARVVAMTECGTMCSWQRKSMRGRWARKPWRTGCIRGCGTTSC